jgi:hypothetical protein
MMECCKHLKILFLCIISAANRRIVCCAQIGLEFQIHRKLNKTTPQVHVGLRLDVCIIWEALAGEAHAGYVKPQEAPRTLQEPLGETLGDRRYLEQRKVHVLNKITSAGWK